MPRKTRPGRSSHAHLQNQSNIAQSNAPITRALPEQSSASQPSGQPPLARQGKDKIKAQRLQKQLKEAEAEKAAVKTAQEWGGEFQQYFEPIASLESDFENASEKAWEDLQYFEEKDEEIAKARPEKKELLEEIAVMRFKRSIKRFDELISSNIYKDLSDAVKRINPVLERFDSLPDKDRLYAIDPRLKVYVEDVKARLAECGEKKAFALHGAILANTHHAISEHNQIIDQYIALMEKMLEGDYSDSIRSDVEKMIAEFDKLSENFRIILARGNEQLEACDRLLPNPYLRERLKSGAVEQYRNSVLANNSFLSMHITDDTQRKLWLLMTLAKHDNQEQQRYENLKEWHESLNSLIAEYFSVISVHTELLREETREYLDPGKLSQDELSIRVQAATEGQNQFEKIIRTCGKRAAEYENLTQIVKDERLPLLLEEMAAKVNECMRNRECAAQMWTDKIRDLELKQSAQASFLPQGSFSRLEQRKTLHRTKEGVVIGRVNQEGGLDSLDETGKILSTYFKDQDSGNWVRDYGGESDPAPSAQSAEPATIGGKTAAREKAENLIQKVRNIVEASARFTRKTQANVEASRDYDDKVGFLHRAFSDKVRAIVKVNTAFIELKKEVQAGTPSEEDWTAFLKDYCLKLLQEEKEKNNLDEPFEQTLQKAGELSGEDLSALLKDYYLETLRKEKSSLDVQLQQAQQDMNIHFRKKRDPTESNFRFLREQGQVASIVQELNRKQSDKNASDWLDRYVIFFTKGPQKEEYEPWVVHAHYNAPDPHVSPVRVHMKRHAEKNWGTERQAYHSPPLSEDTFKLLSPT